MGLLDFMNADPNATPQGYGTLMANPMLYAGLGLLSGVGAGSAPSRMPVTKGMMLGSMANGLLGGLQAGGQAQAQQQQYQQQQALFPLKTQAAGMENANNLLNINMFRQAVGQPPLTADDIKSGKFDMSLPPGVFGPQGGAGQGAGGASPSPMAPGPSAAQPAPASPSQPNQAVISGILDGPNSSPAPTAPANEIPPPQGAPPPVAPAMPGQPPMPGGMPGAPPNASPQGMPSPGPMAGILNGAPPQGIPPQGMPPQGAPPQAPPMQPMPQPGPGMMPPGAGGSNFMGVRLPPGMTPQAYMVLTRLNPQAAARVVGNQYPGPTQALQSLQAAGIDPNSPQGQQYLQNAALNASGVKRFIGGERTGVPLQEMQPNGTYRQVGYTPPPIPGMNVVQNPDGSSGFAPAPGGAEGIARNAAIAENARVAGQKQITDYTNQQQFGTPGTGGPTDPGTPQPGSGPAPALVKVNGTAAIATPTGTIVPLAKGNQVMGPGTDLIGKQNTESIARENAWSSVRPTLDQAENRLFALGQAFQQVETGGLTEKRAEIANILQGAGLTTAGNAVMSAKDTSAVQTSLWNGMQDVLASLKTINAGTGGRILNSEFNAFMEHGFSPDMQPATLHSAISQQLGVMFQTRNMIDDYYGVGRLAGWQDANQYQSHYLKANPLDGFVKYSENALGPFKGMPGGPVDAPPAYTEGQTATNPSNGQRLIFKGGAWTPMQ